MSEDQQRFRVKILLIGEDARLGEAVPRALEGMQVELVLAPVWSAAEHALGTDDFALIFLDLDNQGFDSVLRIRSLERPARTPIVLLVSSQPDGSALRTEDAGAIDYLFKPVDPEILRAKISAFVSLYRANQALRVRDEFLSIASHELKTPLTPLQLQLQGFLRLIDSGKHLDVPKEQLRYMLQISEIQVVRLSRLIEQLLNLSRIDEGRLALDYETINLSELARSTVEQFRFQLNAARCRLKTSLEERLFVQGDRIRLEQVIVNLFTNAIKYAPEGEIEVRTFHEQDSIFLEVRDDGMGIPKEDQSRIFDRFERAVPVKNFGGLGLGLYISREIVRLHRGRITVESEPGRGSLFRVEIPRSPLFAATPLQENRGQSAYV